jgi:uracil-DNA glycosylase
LPASTIKLHESWLQKLQPEFDAPYMARLKSFLSAERELGKTIYPKPSEWLAALNTTTLDQVRVVILGQDPYHGAGQAHGLCFSVREGVTPPPSLQNIYKEIKTDLGRERPRNGNLEHWAQQGVLLLNSVLTVEANQAASHAGKGWEQFTDAVVREVNALPHPVVFMLWGNYAQKKASFVDAQKHHIIKSAHPSPLSAHNGFFGSRPFSRTNDFLIRHGKHAIEWVVKS